MFQSTDRRQAGSDDETLSEPSREDPCADVEDWNDASHVAAFDRGHETLGHVYHVSERREISRDLVDSDDVHGGETRFDCACRLAGFYVDDGEDETTRSWFSDSIQVHDTVDQLVLQFRIK